MVNELCGTPEPPGEGFDELLARLEADAGITPPQPRSTNGKAKDPDHLPDGFERIGASVFDRLAELITWADLLAPLGWQSVPPPDAATAEAWKRPGGTHPVSAKVLKAAPYVLVNWSEDSGLPVGADQKMTMARALAHFHYSRNESALAKDLVRGQARGVPAHVNTRSAPNGVATPSPPSTLANRSTPIRAKCSAHNPIWQLATFGKPATYSNTSTNSHARDESARGRCSGSC